MSDEEQLDLIESRLEDQNAIRMSKLNPAVSQVIEYSIKQLNKCTEFRGHVREHLEPVILSTILFLARCMDIQKGDESRRTSYLFKPDAKEKDLQDDLIDWFRGNEHADPIIEPQDIGGGRAELVFILDGYRFVIELKREQSDASKESLREYLPQTTAYQTTSIPVGILIVLNLTSRGFPVQLRDNVWVEQIPPPEVGGTDRFVLVVRIPGNKVSPSRLRPHK